jgi:hypothetical protein
MDLVQWCGICNARPSDGQLTIENPIEPDGEPVEIEACRQCVYRLDWSGHEVSDSSNTRTS